MSWRPAALAVYVLLVTSCKHAGSIVFHDEAAKTGLVFTHRNGAAGEFHMPEIMGSGVALLDYDNDGDVDVFLIQGMPGSPHRLFRNDLKQTGTLHFTDVSEQAGIRADSTGMGIATGDYDNDGYLDVFVTGFGRNVLYHNNRNGTFTDVTAAAALSDTRWSTSATFVDYDRDGWLDLFVLHYVDYTSTNNKICHSATGERDYCTPKAYKGVPARLYRNTGDGHFVDVSSQSGIAAAYGPGLGTVVTDTNEDGWPDIYVANDTAQNLLWLNGRNGTFQEAALESGLAYAADGIARAGMGVAVGDVDRDGAQDIAVTNLMREGITLFRNLGRGNFDDATAKFGLTRTTTGFTGFGTGLHDFDNDGDLDLFIANGAVTIMEDQRGQPHPYGQRNQILRNEGSTFRDVSGQAGDSLQQLGTGRGAAFADIDNDGDVDSVLTNNNGAVRLLINHSTHGHWLTLDLGPGSIGAQVEVRTKSGRSYSSRVHTDGSYLSASDHRLHFGLGDEALVETITVRWPGGVPKTYRSVRADQFISLSKDTLSHFP